MGSLPTEDVSSLQAIKNSIETDYDVYRWFAFLITQPAVLSQLNAQELLKGLYARFQANLFRQRLWYAAFSLILLACAFFQRPLILLAVPIFACLAFRFYLTNKRHVARISEQMILHDYGEPSLRRITLYQLCEQYGRKYQVASLVDKSCGVNRILRYALYVAAFLMVRVQVQVIPVLTYFVILVFCYCLIKAALTFTGIYRYLR